MTVDATLTTDSAELAAAITGEYLALADLLDGALDWIGTHRRIWDERFEKLDALLADIQGAPKEPSRAKRSAEHKERRNERGDDDG